jgi:hypothetical protein
LLCNPGAASLQSVALEVHLVERDLRGELAVTITMLVLLLAAVLLIANLIGAIHVFG